MAKGARPGVPGRRIEILETAPLGGRKFLHVVRVLGRHLVVSSSPDKISLLTEIYHDQEDGSASGTGAPDREGPSFQGLMEEGP